ncbi:M48 family metalloprotease [Geodermatophilus sp. YIM 151500]|uniref:M48 family metalloprotease n=1 Tax=Geodermatophilus sp. YIM 151500 TaxID=2984531 RepID=UPI0021E39905|nr:M48 family metalloprotease [Geodermatophilus sp. YIM 151500]MCV2489781.1 M48 family metalloprotease [Geodermatophilus sp. YIM 151500]
MGSSGSRPSGSARGQSARFGLWRAIAATPAMIGSLLLLSVVFGALGRWAGLVLLVWVACGAALVTRVGERIAVRAACRFRSLSPAQAVALQRPWSTALRMTGTAAGAVELYVQPAQVPNAYATGGRSVAVTSRVVEDHKSGRLPEDQLVALLVHELGHHATRATRPMLLVSLLAAPWRLAARLLTGIGLALSGRQPRRGLILAIVAGVAVAVTRALFQGQVLAGGVLTAVALASVVCPLADAAVSRRAEFAADRFAADHGLASQLVSALSALDDARRAGPGWPARLLASHPTTGRRISALVMTTAHLHV